MIGLPEALRPISNYRLLIFALALVVLMLLRPQGLWPTRRSRRGSFTALPPAREVQEKPAIEPPEPGSLLLRAGHAKGTRYRPRQCRPSSAA